MLIYNLGPWKERWLDGPGYRHVLFFVDTAGSDIILGCLPLVRWMLSLGSRVTLAANSFAALNHVTAPELAKLIERVQYLDAGMREAVLTGRLSVTGSGARTPLLDLGQLSSQCVASARDSDLIILHGMRRAVEGYWTTAFRCDAPRTAVLEDPAFARHVGGELFDCVFEFTPAKTG